MSWNSDNTAVYYTDGGCRYNGQSYSRGACAYWQSESNCNSWPDPTSPSTNQSAELGAIYGAIRCAIHAGEVKALYECSV